MKKPRLSKEEWIAAGFRALADQGPAALQINHLAAKLEVTKGSFYWHFKDLKEYKSEMLSLWRTKVASEVIAEVTTQCDPLTRLDILLENAAKPVPEEFGGVKTEPAMRAWSLSDSDVASVLNEIDKLRVDFLRQIFDGLGFRTPALADLTYGAYIGLDDLRAKVGTDMPAALNQLRDLILAARLA